MEFDFYQNHSDEDSDNIFENDDDENDIFDGNDFIPLTEEMLSLRMEEGLDDIYTGDNSFFFLTANKKSRPTDIMTYLTGG